MPLPFGPSIRLCPQWPASNSKPSSGPAPRLRPWSSAAASSSCPADPDQPTNQTIAHELDCDRHTVGQWRERFARKDGRPVCGMPRAWAGPGFFPPLGTR